MVFALTEKLEDEILQALENQEQKFLVDAKNSVLVSSDNISADENSFMFCLNGILLMVLT